MKIDPATGLAALPDGYRFFVDRAHPRYEFAFNSVVELQHFDANEWKTLQSHFIKALDAREIGIAAIILRNWLDTRLNSEHLLGAYPPNKLP